MKNNIKIIGAAIAGFILGSATIVFANQAIQAIQNTEIKVDLDGSVQEFVDDSTGEKQYPITYNNRTYLPLRTVAELSGLSVDYDSNTKTVFLKSNDNNVFSNEELLVQEKIRYNLSKELDEKTPGFYNNNYFDLIARADINNDGKSEYIIIIAPTSEAFNMRVFSSTGEELVEGLDQLSQTLDCLEVRKDNNDYILFIETSFGDGLCYENDNIYEVRLVDKKFEVKLLGRYVCDQDEENRKRAALGSDATIEEEAAAHTLRYIVNDKIVSKDEYEKAIKEYKNSHKLVRKIK